MRACILVMLATVMLCNGMIHELDLVEDTRASFLIETFGFARGGYQKIETGAFEFAKGTAPSSEDFCFLIKITKSDSSNFLDEELELTCTEGDIIVKPDANMGALLHEMNVDTVPQGFYNLYFVNAKRVPVTVAITVTQRSVGKNFLAVGHMPLPTLYVIDTVVYVTLIGIWVYVLKGATNTHRLHVLMTGLLVLKTVSVLFQAINFHYLNIVGHPGGWTIASYLINFCEGVSLFCVVALIGTGWQFVKPFLSENDKKIFLVVLPLQILDNIALIVIEDTIPGTQGWEAWKSLFRVVDIVCCGAILVPIIWSISHLKESAGTSGKAARSLQQLQLFRSYYLIVVAYIYSTRILGYLFDATLPYQTVWLSEFFSEAITIAFFVLTGYKFRPMEENPYLKTYDSDDEIDLELDAYGEPTVDLEKLERKKKEDRSKAVKAAALAAEEKLKDMMANKTDF